MLKNLQRKIIGDLRANRGQFLAVWLVVTLGSTFYGAMYPAGVNMLKSFYRTYDQLNYLNLQIQFDSAAPDVVDEVQAIAGVEEAEGRLVVESGLQIDPDQRYLLGLRLISVPDDRAPMVNQSNIMDGRGIQADGEILLLKSFADYHDIQPGSVLPVWINGTEHRLKVVGLAFNPEYVVAGRSSTSPFPTLSSFGVAWMRYSELAAYAGREGEINEVVVHLTGKAADDQDDLEASVQKQLGPLFGDEAAILRRIQTPSGGVVDANVNGNFPIMITFSSMFLIGSTLITSVLLARLVEGERQRIGTMRAMGVTRRELVTHYLTFGLIIGVSGGLVGSVLGYLNSFWVMHTYLHYIVGGTLPGFVNTPQIPFILLGLAISVVGSTFAGMYPAWVQSATPPGIALRPATPKTPNAISRLQMRRLPAPLRWAVRNLLRVPGRSFSTALGIVAGALMIFSSFALWDTLARAFSDYYDASTFDLRVDLNTVQMNDTLEGRIEQIPGVTAVQAVLFGPVAVVRPAGGEPFQTFAVSMDETDPFLKPVLMDGTEFFARPDGVWIGHNARRVLGVDVGDTLTLTAFNQSREVKVLGVVSYAMGSPIFVPRSLLMEWAGGVFPTNSVFVRVAEGQDQAVRDALVDLPGMVAVELTDDFQGDTDRYLTYFRAGTVIFGTFGYILTLAVLFNTVNGSLRERRDELAVMRALGSTRREIALTVTLELLLMVVLGLLIGIPIGREIGFWLNSTYETEFFGSYPSLSPIWYGVGVVSMLVIVLVAEIPGLRAVQKVDLGQVSKSQSF